MKELKMYIDGRFIENQSDKWIDVLNPSTEEVISKMPDGTPEDARAAINAAVKAQLSWESLTSIERAGYLTRIAQGIRKREQELTDIIIREGGKTRGLANVEDGPVVMKGKSFLVTVLTKIYLSLRNLLG